RTRHLKHANPRRAHFSTLPSIIAEISGSSPMHGGFSTVSPDRLPCFVADDDGVPVSTDGEWCKEMRTLVYEAWVLS
ncbi:MAG: hypothetical protein WCA08_02755, partial [Desulfoferrobacter sp.]